MLIRIALASLKSRKTSVILTLVSIVISVSLLLGVEFIRGQIKQSFTRTVSGVDLIVGAPTGELNLLLYSVFRMGNATQGVSWEQVERLQNNPLVKWVAPVSLGDSHKGFRVVGTDQRYFTHYQYGNEQPLKTTVGHWYENRQSAVIGADVAAQLGYQPGAEIVISHGLGNVSFHQHDSHPFIVSGILEKTGTPVDSAVHITLSGIEQIHSTSQARRRIAPRPRSDADSTNVSDHDHAHAGEHHDAEHHTDSQNTAATAPAEVTAIFVGLTSRAAALQLQYVLNQKNPEPVLAILPGMALSQLWQLMSNVERLLLGISSLILLASLTGLITMMLASMRERQQEIAVFRAMGAGPLRLLWLVQSEALAVALVGSVIALGLNSIMFYSLAPLLSAKLGLFINGNLFTVNSAVIIGCVLVATWLCSFIPAIAAYRHALHAGLNHR